MTKKVKPDLPIPELEMQDYTEKKMSDMENRLLVSENKLREKDAREELNRRRQSLITKGLARDDADVEQIEKIMLSKNISNHETAAEYFDWMKQAAEPTPSGYNPSAISKFDLSKYWKNPQMGARDEAAQALKDIRNVGRKAIGI
jgi:hypothetical protein